MGSSSKDPRRVLLVPWSTDMGHFTPALHLMQLLAKRGMNVTVWLTEERVSEVRSLISREAFGTLDVEVVDMFTRPDESRGRNRSRSELFAEQLDRARERGKVDLSRFKAVISDFFNYFIQTLAEEWNVPHFFLYSSPAALASVFLHGPSLLDGGWHPRNEAKKDEFVPFLGLQCFTASDIPEIIFKDSHQMHEAITKSDGFVINSFDAYDESSTDEFRTALQSKQERPGKAPQTVYNVGPLILLNGISGKEEEQRVDRHETLVWLDQQPRASVLFASFGSLRAMPRDMSLAIAKALLDSRVSFLWVLRVAEGSSKRDLLPYGFEEETITQGLVVTSWVPQREILDHPSLSAFLSHCGWNSTLESISSGVPMIACPMCAEQSLNARYMSEKVGIALRVKGRRCQFKAEDIADNIARLMRGSEGQEIRKKMQKLSMEAHAAADEGGSSHQQFEEFFAHVSGL